MAVAVVAVAAMVLALVVAVAVVAMAVAMVAVAVVVVAAPFSIFPSSSLGTLVNARAYHWIGIQECPTRLCQV